MFVQNQNFGLSDSLQYNFQMNAYDYPAHIHQFAEIGYVLSGELEVVVNGRLYQANAGDFILIFPMQVHEYRTPSRCTAIISAFGNTLVPELSDRPDGMVGETPVFRCEPSVEQFFRETFISGALSGIPMPAPSKADLAETYSHFADLRKPEILCRLKAVLNAVAGEYFATVNFVRADSGAESLAKVLLYLHAHYTEPITLDDVAEALGYSTNYLSHRIKRATGMGFHVLLGNLRVEHAVRLLTGSGNRLRMIDAALESGFATERSFHRTFKRVTGITPGDYRLKRWPTH